MSEHIRKYPRTHHIEGSRLQPGDEDLDSVPIASLSGAYLVIEEKLDGANAGLSFSADGGLKLQSRGHFLTGGYRERHFNLFKTWASAHQTALWDVIGDRYIVYGEWLYAKHTVFYDQLPHYFMEFDVLDRKTDEFMSTARRHELWVGSSITSVPVLWRGRDPSVDDLRGLIGHSLYKSAAWKDRLTEVAQAQDLDPARTRDETDPSDDMEGLYIKVETDDHVVGRYKFIRPSFLTSVLESGSHWLNRPIVPNQLRSDVDLFAVPE